MVRIHNQLGARADGNRLVSGDNQVAAVNAFDGAGRNSTITAGNRTDGNIAAGRHVKPAVAGS